MVIAAVTRPLLTTRPPNRPATLAGAAGTREATVTPAADIPAVADTPGAAGTREATGTLAADIPAVAGTRTEADTRTRSN